MNSENIRTVNKEEPSSGSVGTALIASVSELAKAAIATTQGKKAAGNVGDCAVIITETVKNCLLPLVAINTGFDNAREYFDRRFPKEISDKLNEISPENIVEPKPSIAGPSMQNLAFSHEEIDLKEMYLSLLATSMNKKKMNNAHPSFAEIIKQLTSEEAKELKTQLSNSQYPSTVFRVEMLTYNNKYIIVKNHLDPFVGDEWLTIERQIFLESYFENWIRLGLVNIEYGELVDDPDFYKYVESKFPKIMNLSHLKEDYGTGLAVVLRKGAFRSTAFGIRFGSAVGLF